MKVARFFVYLFLKKHKSKRNNKKNTEEILLCYSLWVLMDSNHRSRKTADLQSAPFGHSGKHPHLWALRDSNPRPSACKADALNQLS